MLTFTKSLVIEAEVARFNSLPADIQEQLREYGKKREMTDELLLIKKTRPKIVTGDVFVVQPKEGFYLYGRVLNGSFETKIDDRPIWSNAHIICIYRCKTNELSLRDFKPNYDDLILKPEIVSNQIFTSGYFYRVGHIDLTEEEKKTRLWILCFAGRDNSRRIQESARSCTENA